MVEFVDRFPYYFDKGGLPVTNAVDMSSDARTDVPGDPGSTYVQLTSASSLVAVPVGVYEYGFSVQWRLNSAIREAMMAFSTNGGASWDVGLREPKDAQDKNFTYYSFPKVISSSAILTIEVHASIFVGGGLNTETFEAYFADAWIQRVG